MKRKILLIVLVMFAATMACEKYHFSAELNIACALESDIKYCYDAAGRLIRVTYPDGKVIQYEYDANGNMTSNQITEKESLQEDEKEPEQESGKTMHKGNGYKAIGIENIELLGIGQSHETAQDKQAYEKFKKKKPVIKSLKTTKKKKKYYLSIQVKKLSGLGEYTEHGYEVKYATNKKFKKAKTLTFNKKGSITGKKWKVKKGKQYWVKVRAYMKTKSGKVIYSKYSKTKKITIKK